MGEKGKKGGGKEEWTREKAMFLSLLFSVLPLISLTMTYYVNVNWFGCLPQGLDKIKRTKGVKYTLKHWNFKAHCVMSLEKWMSSRPDSYLQLMDKLKGRVRAESYIMAPASGNSLRACGGGGGGLGAGGGEGGRQWTCGLVDLPNSTPPPFLQLVSDLSPPKTPSSFFWKVRCFRDRVWHPSTLPPSHPYP